MRIPRAGAVLAAAALLACGMARAQFSEPECKPLAALMSGVVQFRDTEAKPDKVVALVHASVPRAGPERRAALEREIRRVFASSADADAVEKDVYTRCLEGLGQMRREG